MNERFAGHIRANKLRAELREQAKLKRFVIADLERLKAQIDLEPDLKKRKWMMRAYHELASELGIEQIGKET